MILILYHLGIRAGELLSLKVSILNAKKTILASLGYLQIGIVAFGIALTAMLSATLMLALSTGIPKEKDY